MATFSLKPSSAKYGWSSDSSTTNVSAANSLWCGACKNSDGYNRPYDGSMRFSKSLESISGGIPIVVTSATVTVTYRNHDPSKPLNVFINEIEAAYWHAYKGNGYVGETTGNYKTFTSTIDKAVPSPTSGVESKYIIKSSKNLCQKLTEYLNNNKTFYIHLWNNVGSNTGGVFKGYRETGDVLTINWEYAASQATFTNGNSLKTGVSATLKLNQADPTFKHQIDWQIKLPSGSYSTIKAYTDITSSTNDYTFSPSASQISTWFKGATKIDGKVVVTTKNNDGVTLGTKETPFTLTLTKASAKDFQIDSFTMSPVTPDVLGGTEKYVKSKTRIKCTGQYTKSNSNVSITEAKVTLTGGISSSLTLNGGSGQKGEIITSNYISKQSNITATWTIKDSRNFTWTKTATIDASYIKNYTSPKITSLTFYRSSGSEESIEGTKLGLSFKVTTDNSLNFNNYIDSVTLNDETLNPDTNSATWTYSSKNVFSSETYNLSQNYNFTLKVTDKAGTTTTKTFILPSSKYLIHIPNGGGAIAFGTTVPSNGTGYIHLGWPVKGLEIAQGESLKIFETSISSFNSLEQAMGGPFLPTAGGTVTGNLTIAKSQAFYLTNSEGSFSALYAGANFYVGLRALAGLQKHGKTYIGLGRTLNEDGTYTINRDLYLRQSPTADNETDGKTYTVYHSGNIFYSAADTDGTPSSVPGGEPVKGMIWLKPITS